MSTRIPDASFAEYQRAAHRMRLGTISDSSRRVYLGSCIRFIYWCSLNLENVYNSQFGQNASGSATQASIKSALEAAFLSENPEATVPPILFERLQPNDFIAYLLSLRNTRTGSSNLRVCQVLEPTALLFVTCSKSMDRYVLSFLFLDAF
jgi:hypothetical protein